MKTYELVYIVSSEIASEEATAKAKEIESAIISREGAVLKQSIPTARTFSYPIGNTASGFFGVVEFQLESEKLLEVKEIIEKDKQIVRHMITIKRAAEFKKERRTRKVPGAILESTEEIIKETTIVKEPQISEPAEEIAENNNKKTKEKEKVELKDIEQELDEILG